MNRDQAAQLREPFPAELIGSLPRAGITLDYVGHAAVTDRLLQVDPNWTWEPFAIDETGAPRIIRHGEDSVLWIRLTILDVTTIGVGIVAMKSFELEKQLVSDALRNAAMRRGVALDLWSKEDLQVIPSASPAVVADLKLRMDSLPPNERTPCKRMFFDCFGKPDDLKESDVHAATKMVADYEARESDPPADSETSVEPDEARTLVADPEVEPAASPLPDASGSISPEQIEAVEAWCKKDPGRRGPNKLKAVASAAGVEKIANINQLTAEQARKVIAS